MISCTRHFNIKMTYGLQRIGLISGLIAAFVFIVSFELYSALVFDQFDDRYFMLFVIAFVLLYPVHKFFHLLLFLHDRKSLLIQRIKHKYFPPLINIRVNHPISKLHFALALITPFIVISAITLASAFSFPSFAHYFLALFAMNFGISFVDFIYFKYIIETPRGTFIEERKYGLELLAKYDN